MEARLLADKFPTEIQAIFAKYPPSQRRSAVMPLLHLAQQAAGAISSETLAEVGWDEVRTMCETYPDLPVIVLSTGDTVSTAVDAMRAGASDFLVRPVASERLLAPSFGSSSASRTRGCPRRVMPVAG